MRIIKADIIFYEGKRILGFEVPFSQASTWLEQNAHKLPADYEIKRRRLKRSNNANSYMWVLADKIASAIGITKEEVYRAHIRDVGVFNDIVLEQDAVKKFIEAWQLNGIGWFAETLHYIFPDKEMVRVYYGSSVYDTKQMSRLIDNIVNEAKSLGIETLTPQELELMINSWKGTNR